MNLGLWWKRNVARVEAATSGYLPQMGWIETRACRLARDRAGRAIPWFTYPAIALLSERVKPTWRVLEFGAGMGTIWWTTRAGEVVAVEHDRLWAKRVASQCDARLLVAGDESPSTYLAPVSQLDGVFDMVVVDGIFRNECIEAALGLLGESGVVILDDAQRKEYEAGFALLHRHGFRALPLHGPQPVSKHAGCTAIFYRDNNAMGL